MTSMLKRRFTLFDAAALVAATCVGLALLRPALGALEVREMRFPGRWPWLGSWIFHGLICTTPILFAWSVAALIISLRRPRPPFRVRVRSPGFVVNATAVFAVLCVSMHYVGQELINPGHSAMTYMHVASTGLPGDVGYFVAGSMFALALSGRLRPGRDWTDRIGWLLGWVWIAMSLLTWSRLYLHLLG